MWYLVASSYEVAHCNQLNTPHLTLTHSARYKYVKNTKFPQCLVCLFWTRNMDIKEDLMPKFKCTFKFYVCWMYPKDTEQHQHVINLLNDTECIGYTSIM